jgi:hypothetical protein
MLICECPGCSITVRKSSPRGKHQRGCTVMQIVDPHLWQAGCLELRLEAVGDVRSV